jgi:hypothetical protein
MGMTTVTIRVEHEGRTPKHDLGVQEKLTIEQITQCKFDLVCYTMHKLFDMINKALEEERNARSPRKDA